MSQNPSMGIVQPTETNLAAEELAAVEKLQKGYHNMKAELGKVIVGQDQVIEELLIALFCRGHAMLEGVPGLAKTLLISTLSRTLGLTFNRIAGPGAIPGVHRGCATSRWPRCLPLFSSRSRHLAE